MKSFSKIKLKKYAFVWTIMAFPVANFLIFWLFSNFGSLIMAFQSRDFLGNVTGWVGFENFSKFLSDVFHSPVITTALKNTCLMYGTELFIITPLQLLFSYYLFRKIPGYRIIKFILMLPAIISGFVVCLVFKKFVEGALPTMMRTLFSVEGFPNLVTDPKYSFGLMLFYNVWLSFTTTLIMYTNAMGQIDDSVLESAKIDGIHEGLQEFFTICCPLVFPTLTTFLVTGFSGFLSISGPLIAFWKFDAPPQLYTLGYWMYIQVASTTSQVMYPYLAAGGFVMTGIMAPLTFLLKHLLEKYGPSTEC
ncbi:MAG: sugar ABC transporter permease [Clostridia bacterium]|nr:sugar ABC transporter permease [Clostridiales bacterium]MDD7165145.1 sugar ABC transporter permease [Clostridia bacterium]MDY2901212.1 sugar ABC transporter permease [Christensenellaceae bacterium]